MKEKWLKILITACLILTSIAISVFSFSFAFDIFRKYDCSIFWKGVFGPIVLSDTDKIKIIECAAYNNWSESTLEAIVAGYAKPL
ncbi:MAG: hypothetical protein A3J59_01245 [Candidatus Buchananbacteria bacterium RIFCSPHIGHO2_02_FULL_56_16]|uniref:Uncharacterized protein n=1 Tax=Candidatus Buchananbacteria bacterium RIFCSPHIGHO2_02_FULL_56_16 TaxID=1797542 RepID=A0A1G1YDF6_9BACT|nr:MAG: hypothetical protein A3J59_01245 [Candidatus Buchananbacteria bacterium RIFCSPHIGHO2_02_FULL_56_16]